MALPLDERCQKLEYSLTLISFAFGLRQKLCC